MKKILILSLLTLSLSATAQQQFAGIAELDKSVHNFGDVMLSDGPLDCTFKLKNVSSKPIVVYSVVSSCGCTNVNWTKSPLKPGESADITATYSNDEGPYPFDKTLTVYVSGVESPIILKIKGVSHKEKESPEQLYPVSLGGLGVKSTDIKVGNMDQGNCKSDEVSVANLTGKELKVEFKDLSPQLSVKVEPNPIPAYSTASMKFTVTADRKLWGKNYYYCTPSIGGKTYGKLSFWAITKENFSNITKEQKDNAPRPMFNGSTHDFGTIKNGTIINVEFVFTNSGKSPFIIYKADADSKGVSVSPVPDVPAGGKGTLKLRFDSTGLPLGETLITLTLITNSPSRPLINLFLSGTIQ